MLTRFTWRRSSFTHGIHFPILPRSLSAADQTPEIINIIQPTGTINKTAAASSIHPSTLPALLLVLFSFFLSFTQYNSLFSGRIVFIIVQPPDSIYNDLFICSFILAEPKKAPPFIVLTFPPLLLTLL